MYSRTRHKGFIWVLAPIRLTMFLWKPIDFIKPIFWRKSFSSVPIALAKSKKTKIVKVASINNTPFITKSELEIKVNLETNQYDNPKNCYIRNRFKISERLSRYHLRSSLIQNVSTKFTNLCNWPWKHFYKKAL